MLSNQQLEWNKENLRSVRMRLGWSRSDMARRLNCLCSDIESWEDGRTLVTTEIKSDLEMILSQANFCNEEVRCSPVAEIELTKSSLSQIEFSRVKADLE